MEEVEEHLNTIVNEADRAYEKAPLGTKLMLGELVNDARKLRSRVRNLNEPDTGQ